MPPFDPRFARRLGSFREGILPWLKESASLLRASPGGSEVSPEPESPRSYSPGDDVRAIDWTLFARLDRLFLRTWTREEEVPLLIALDVSASMAAPEPAKLARAAEVAAALGDLALTLGQGVYLAPWADGLAALHGPFRGEAGLDGLLGQLAALEGGGPSALGRSLRELAALEELRGSAAVLISDFLFPLEAADELLLLGRRTASARVLQLLAGEEVEPALRGNLILIDPEGGAERPLVGGYRVARRFQQLVLEHLDAVESIALRAGARFVRERSERPFEAIARAMLG